MSYGNSELNRIFREAGKQTDQELDPASAQLNHHITQLLVREAERKNKDYASLGIDALIESERGSGSKLVPNKRFLRNVVRNAESHNSALSLQETTQDPAYADDTQKRRRLSPDLSDRQQKAVEQARAESKANRERLLAMNESERDRRKRPHSRSHSAKEYDQRGRRPYSRSRSPPRQSRRRRPSEEDRRHRSPESRHHRHRRREKGARRPEQPFSDSECGPSLPTANGRGRADLGSEMDKHFAADYDPFWDREEKTNDDFVDDWGMAMEASRDRQKWKVGREQRMAEAGWDTRLFSSNARQSSETQAVQYRKIREWDAGKIEDGDFYDTRPNWA